MLLPIYVLTLCVSAAITGAFGRRLLASQGYMPDFDAGLVITIGLGFAYIAVQLLYMAFLRLAKPTQSNAPLLSESLSHLGALFLVPYLFNISVPWPHPLLVKVEPLLYVAAFAAVHGFFKLVSLFSTTRAQPSGRLGAVGWLTAALLSLIAVQVSYSQWHEALQAARVLAPQDTTGWRAGDAHTLARRALEGAIYTFDMTGMGGRNIVVRLAPLPEAPQALTEAYLSISVDGRLVRELSDQVELKPNAWTEVHIPAEYLPPRPYTCTLMWRRHREATWIQETGLRPVDPGAHEILISGPHFYLDTSSDELPNFVFLVVDGMGAEHFTGLGYARDTTPTLAAFGRGAHMYTHAYTPAPEAAAASMSLLTGVNPLVHGFLGGNLGYRPRSIESLAEILQEAGYATAAFTEGETEDGADLFFGSGFERGFDYFDDAVPATGSHATLDKAAQWAERHQMHRFMLFVRLRELSALQPRARYGTTFSPDLRRARPLDVYDSALFYLVKQLGAFLQRLRTLPDFGGETCIVIAAPYGLDFSDGWNSRGRAGLREGSLRVPLIMQLPGERGVRSEALVQIEDVLPTLVAYAGLEIGHQMTGVSLLEQPRRTEVYSMEAEPLAVSLRNADWRFTYQTGLYPFSRQPQAEQAVAQFVNMEYYRRNWRQERWATREGTLGDRYRIQVMGYVRRYLPPNLFEEATTAGAEAPAA